MIFEDAIEAIEESDVSRIAEMREAINAYRDPWEIHLSLFPAVQRVLNPPFINPHLPKMYSVCRDFLPYLSKTDTGPLVYLELVEYARRAKLDGVTPKSPPPSNASFPDIEKAISEKDRGRVAMLFSAFVEQQGMNDFVRRLLLLGSGYLGQSLGHSISCTAFILRELIERPGENQWPSLVLLSDYFCKGGFTETPTFAKEEPRTPLREHLSRAVRGSGFVDLHHTIALYAIEQVRSFFTPAEHNHMIAAWAAFVGDKQAESPSVAPAGKTDDYPQFLESFSRFDVEHMVGLIGGMIVSPEDRSRLCGFLVRGVCDLYQGSYDPHYLTGLGSLLWIINTFHDDAVLVLNALHQYLGFYFRSMKAEK